MNDFVSYCTDSYIDSLSDDLSQHENETCLEKLRKVTKKKKFRIIIQTKKLGFAQPLSNTSRAKKFLKYVNPSNASRGLELLTGQSLELHEACTIGDYESLKDYLKNSNFDINGRDPDFSNRTPLHWACSRGYVDCAKLLIDHGCKVNIKMDMGWTPFHCAAESGKLNIIRLLLANGASISLKDRYSKSASDIAHLYGFKDIVNHINSQ
ncbi:hypothetical protein A3Q56_02053 [Intoshia linei]|uniref:Uncharacterized protein n=1 Tax=Intoshia linei TaxID=1819745 RepID=A0A177B9F8_9BILA|nr:hypothetical protein A3Q56_02053 [Intoshia linei]